ncbi:hypothetical protein [Saccharospirillum salsuginis]|uniref:Uncharacterized protein n=1 Tax=Saccharospirillum salsuginis TaxID=418750 RepID=A0A918KTA3_9GAMM|nr:hypothetical protein [Saccharospirillum salsuginis]GGX75296.1 hypothetical protein GCM10007392_48050 [Saccharospirillum salsuginis]
MTDDRPQIRQLIRIRQRRVDAADLERGRLAERKHAQAATIETLVRQRSALADQRAVLRQQRIEQPIRATDLQRQDQYQHRLQGRIDALDRDIDRERQTFEEIEAALQQALRRWRQARASLDALEQQWRRLQRQHRRRNDKKDERTLDDLSVGRHTGAEPMNWQTSTRIDTHLESATSGRSQPQPPSREDRGRFERMLDEVKSRDPDAEQTEQNTDDESETDPLAPDWNALNGPGTGASNEAGLSETDRPLTQLNTPAMPAAQALEPSVHSQPAPGTNQSDFADLMARHVQQMLVSEPMNGKLQHEQQLMLRLSDQILPNTQVMLSRNAQGWTLKAQSSGRDNLDLIRKSSDKLVSRFSEAGLGDLNVETELQEAREQP